MGYLDLTARQTGILRKIVSSDEPVSLQQLADHSRVNIRTVQRDLCTIESVLAHYHLSLVKRKGLGIQVEGSTDALSLLRNELSKNTGITSYTPEQRQHGLICDLLLAREPLKTYVFSSKYGVTEATISNDLDKVEQWFANFDIQVIRKPGLGVFLQGTEKQFRLAVSGVLLQNIRIEEWLKLFTLTKGKNEDEKVNIQEVIDSHLLEFVPVNHIVYVEKSIQEVLNHQTEIKLTDREYVGLVVHLTLAIERVKQGNILQHAQIGSTVRETNNEYDLARRIAKRLEEYLDVSIPAIEIEYIAVHLHGSVRSQMFLEHDLPQDGFVWSDLVKSFVVMAEYFLNDTLTDDRFLIEGLMAHFSTAIKRLELGLTIHNPLLEQIKANYPEVFQACQQASIVIAEALGKSIPEAEIGYLTMHVGAALIRNKDKSPKQVSAVVVCASGIGTSRFLASRLKKEFKTIRVVDVITVNELQQWLRNHNEVDLIISTVSIPDLDSDHLIHVTPFLNQDDMNVIRNKVERISKNMATRKYDTSSQNMLAMARYGEGLLQILRNFSIQTIQDIPTSEDHRNRLRRFLNAIQFIPAICDFQKLLTDLEIREQKGVFVFERLAMIHAKTDGVRELFVALFRFPDNIAWGEAVTLDGQTVQTCLLLAVPTDSPPEHLEMISEITASLVDDTFLQALHTSSEDECKQIIYNLLSVTYMEKTRNLLKEQPMHE